MYVTNEAQYTMIVHCISAGTCANMVHNTHWQIRSDSQVGLHSRNVTSDACCHGKLYNSGVNQCCYVYIIYSERKQLAIIIEDSFIPRLNKCSKI